MANKSINALDNTSTLANQDLLVLWKASANAAYNISGQDFTAMLTSLADGHGGISGIAKTSTSGLDDTYTITYADGTTSSFVVTNGAKGDTGDQTFVWIAYSAVSPTSDADVSVIPAPWMGVYVGLESTQGNLHYTDYTWYEIKGEKGDTGDGVTSIERTGGAGNPGETDTYTVYAGETVIGTFYVYNGINGSGSVSSVNSIYPDSNGNVELNTQNIRPRALVNRTILLLGDSYNHGDGGTVPKGWGYYFNQFNGTTGTIIQQGGGGFAALGGTGAQYPNMNYADVIGQLDQSSDYDLIIAQAGWNDANPDKNPSGASAIATGMDSFVSAVYAKWPNAEIIVIPTFNSGPLPKTKEVCLNAIATSAFDNGVRSCSQAWLWLKAGGYTANDGVHLNDAGYQALATYITRFVRGWDGIVARPHETNRVTISGTTNSNGAISLTSAVADSDSVLSVECENVSGAICIPWKYNNGNWWCWVQQWSDRTFYNNTAVTLKVTYMGA